MVRRVCSIPDCGRTHEANNMCVAHYREWRRNGSPAQAVEPAPINTRWVVDAACRPGTGVPPELFFPVGTSGPALLQIAEAKTVCRRCPVRAECLSWAVNTRQEYGVFGGMSEDERRGMRRRRAVKTPAEVSA